MKLYPMGNIKWSLFFLFFFPDVLNLYFFTCHGIYFMSQWTWHGPKEDELVKYIDGWLGLVELPGGTDICDMRTTGNLFLLAQEGNSKHGWGGKCPSWWQRGRGVGGGVVVEMILEWDYTSNCTIWNGLRYTVIQRWYIKNGWTENPGNTKHVLIQLKEANLIVLAGKIKWQHLTTR